MDSLAEISGAVLLCARALNGEAPELDQVWPGKGDIQPTAAVVAATALAVAGFLSGCACWSGSTLWQQLPPAESVSRPCFRAQFGGRLAPLD